MNHFSVTAKSKDFSYAVKLAKKRGAEYDAARKTWFGDDSVSESLRMYPEYFTEVRTTLVENTSSFDSRSELRH